MSRHGLALIVDAIITLTFLEAGALVIFHKATGRGIGPSRLLPNLAAGLCLMIALRLVLADEQIGLILLCFAGALLAHLTDLRLRWNQLGTGD